MSKFPYPCYTKEEVDKMESGYYNLQMGGDFVIQDKFYLFTKSEMVRLYNSTLKDLIDITKNGSEKDRAYAIDLIGTLVIRPMRLH